MASMDIFRKVPASRLFVSEPNPAMFGNAPNPKDWRSRGWSNANWLKSRFHFSFAEYSNPANQQFGVLRVMNDDLVQPQVGFGEHPHRDMEILTYIVQGQLTHADSMGSSETLGKGAVQFMTAGSGIYHSEQNASKEPCRFIQSWVTPRTRGLPPKYGSFAGDAAARHNRWHLVAGPQGSAAPILIEQDAYLSVAELDASSEVNVELKEGQQAYMLCVEGSTTVTGKGITTATSLEMHDAAEMYGPSNITLTAGTRGGHFLMFTMPRTGRGRTDL